LIMPQGPLVSAVALNPSKAAALLSVNAEGELITAGAASSTSLAITTQTVVKATPGVLAKLIVLVAGNATGTANDCATTGAVGTSNEIFVIPETVGIYDLNWPCLVGIVITPGTGQTVSVSFA